MVAGVGALDLNAVVERLVVMLVPVTPRFISSYRSIGNWRTTFYDKYQRCFQGIL